ncbi:hypothetical protein D9615_002413 [Tricholomella constricta]|uniref:XPG-I domain-containing protein n=1 Tax=Tricholomella constricta TaxID=117010 RepID=A0A8H5HMT8_9AGAR|nr:hypothetical protein D9615_002413 [Tricholomella constricta]
MGVPGLWEYLNDIGQQRALAHLAVVDGFEKNKSAKRAYRIGVDVSIWYNHALYSKEGENPQLRLMFFRLRQLSELPILPLFVFDGRQRPKVKRNSRMGKSGSHHLSKPMKELLDAFGMEWREAKGEAEAELAYLNLQGHIDAILTDDCDALVFGGRTIINNWSANLSRNNSNSSAQHNSASSRKKPQVTLYTSERIHRLGLSRGDLILYALLAGGDYHNGVDGFGPKLSFGLARCGFGNALLKAYEDNGPHIQPFLTRWRNDINTELATNSRGFLPRAHVAVPSDFPNLDILKFYAKPIRGEGGAMRDKGELNLVNLANFCEKYFEWGFASSVITRFRDLLWPSAVMHVLRRAALEADEKERAKQVDWSNRERSVRGALLTSHAEDVGTPASLVKESLAPPYNETRQVQNDRIAPAFVNRGPQPTPALRRRDDISDPHPLITKVVGTRHDASTGGLLEYRIEVSPIQLVAFTRLGLTGSRPEPNPPPNSPRKPPPHPDSILRLWVPGSMLRHVHPKLIEDYMLREEAKENKSPRTKGKRKAATLEEEDEAEDDKAAASSLTSTVRQTLDQAPIDGMARTALPAPWHPELTESHVLLNPRFSGNLKGHSMRMRFLFTFPDPDEPGFTEFDADSRAPFENDMLLSNGDIPDDAPGTSFDTLGDQISDGRGKKSKAKNQQSEAKQRAGDDGMLDDIRGPIDDGDAPRTSFDALWDQILDRPSKKGKAKKKPREPKGSKATANPASSSTTSPKARTSGPLLTQLDKINARRVAKRQKVAMLPENGDEALAVALASSSAFPLLSELNHLQVEHSSSSSRPWEKTAQTSGHQRCAYYREPSFSQDSRLSSRDDDIIDLT